MSESTKWAWRGPPSAEGLHEQSVDTCKVSSLARRRAPWSRTVACAGVPRIYREFVKSDSNLRQLLQDSQLQSRVAEQNQSNQTCSACPRLLAHPAAAAVYCGIHLTEEWAGRGVSPDGGVARCHGWDHRRRLVSGQGAIPGLLSGEALPNPGGRCRLLGAGCATSPDVFLFQIRGPTVLPCDSEAGGATTC